MAISTVHPGPHIPSAEAEIPFARRPWAYRLALGLLALGTLLNLIYLWNHCPLDLSEDEAHYWEWSRHLDYGYYSKGPGIAWIMAATTWVGRFLNLGIHEGHATMPLLRTAAVGFSVLSGLLSLSLARRIFRDDRAALLVTLISGAVPMFVVGALLITIDAPMYACWALATYCLWRHVEPDRGIASRGPAWLYGAGLAVGLGMLVKPVLLAVPLCAALAAILSPLIRQRLATWHSLAAGLLALALQAPILVWNAQHDWVTLRHLGGQAGVGQKSVHWYKPLARVGEFVAGQAGGMGGIMFVLLVVAVGVALRQARAGGAGASASAAMTYRQTGLRFLLAFTLPLWLFYLVLNLWAGTQVNWPAASYFAGMVLLAGIASLKWDDAIAKERRAWRGWMVGAIGLGLVLAVAAQNTQIFYPLVRERAEASGKGMRSWWHPRKWDPSLRIRAIQERAAAVNTVWDQMTAETGRRPLVVTTRYDTSSMLAFYLPGRPFVFAIMSETGGRHCQYDIWPGLNERRPDGALVHAGADVLLVGGLDPAAESMVRQGFARVEGPRTLAIEYQGLVVRELEVWRCYGFKGLAVQERGGF